MKVDRDVLEKKLLLAINEVITNDNFNKNTIDKIKKQLTDRNIFNATQIFNGNIPLNMASDQVLYTLADAIYNETELYIANPENYFMPTEIQLYKDFERKIEDKRNDIIEFPDMIKIDNNHYIGRIWSPYLVELCHNLRITYNPKAQRETKNIEVDGEELHIPKTFPNKVKEIKTKLVKRTYISDDITINLSDNEETGEKANFKYKNNKIIIYGGKLAVIDGFNRTTALLDASRITPIDGFFELRFTCFDISEAQEFIVQKDKQTKINTRHIQSMDLSKYHNSITDELNKNRKSDLQGKIVTDRKLINQGFGLVLFDIIANSIRVNFDIKTKRQSDSIQEFLLVYFNELYNLYYDEFEDRKGLYASSFSFIGYIAIASEIYKKSNWRDLMLDALVEIDFTKNNTFYQKIKRHLHNEVSRYTIERISKYFTSPLRDKVV